MELNEEQTEKLREIFKQNDIDGNGRLSEPELRVLLSEFDIDESFAPALLRIFVGTKKDKENSDVANGVSFENLLEFFKVLISGNIRDFFRMLFNAMDTNNDGGIDVNDLISFSGLVGDKLTDEDANDIIEQCDLNKDGKVQFEDFWKWYCSTHPNVNEEE